MRCLDVMRGRQTVASYQDSYTHGKGVCRSILESDSLPSPSSSFPDCESLSESISFSPPSSIKTRSGELVAASSTLPCQLDGTLVTELVLERTRNEEGAKAADDRRLGLGVVARIVPMSGLGGLVESVPARCCLLGGLPAT